MKDKLLDYIAAAENAANPITEPSCDKNVLLVEMNELYGDAPVSNSNGSNLDLIKAAATEELKMFHNLCFGLDITEGVDVLTWYESVKYKVPKIYRMALYIFSIPPTEIQNERDFSLAGVFGQARRASLSVQMLSDLLFINQNSDTCSILKNIDLFQGNLNSVDNSHFDEVEQFLESNNETED